jgi:hypothetical protein
MAAVRHILPSCFGGWGAGESFPSPKGVLRPLIPYPFTGLIENLHCSRHPGEAVKKTQLLLLKGLYFRGRQTT